MPQFIEVEDKIFGPLTFKQFIYVAGGAGMVVLLFIFLPKFLAIIISLPIVLFAAALAFYKINDKPFINVVEAFVKYTLTSKLYIWKKESLPPKSPGEPRGKPVEQIYVPKLSESKLKELTWSLDIKENQNPITKDTNDRL
ncbi:MAG: PrgI family protein [bacterium]|nr:PrgI family protein [bacterium]